MHNMIVEEKYVHLSGSSWPATWTSVCQERALHLGL